MNDVPQSNAEKALAICPLFESEILVWLLLRNWNHALADDTNFRSSLLETATDVLMAAVDNSEAVFIQGLPSSDMNLISALWYAENLAIGESNHIPEAEMQGRVTWLNSVKHALPSCFCPQDDLPPEEFN